LGIAGYLTWVHYFQLELFCLAGGCEQVQTSSYSELLGIPVALLGVAGYLLILVSLLIPGDTGRLLGLIFSFVGLGYSLYLTYLELFQIHAICQWCVASAVTIALLTILTSFRYLRSE
ncbi:MAG: vitamin K epoxide reductase family protein, partial [Thermoleophilia bacterium]